MLPVVFKTKSGWLRFSNGLFQWEEGLIFGQCVNSDVRVYSPKFVYLKLASLYVIFLSGEICNKFKNNLKIVIRKLDETQNLFYDQKENIQ